MTLTASYVGAASIGASDQNPAGDLTYTIPITVPADGWLIGVESAWHTGALQLHAAVYADNGGVPGVLVAASGRTGLSFSLSSTPRWVTCPLFVWLTAGTYHIGVNHALGLGAAQLRSTTGGSSGDGHTVDGGANFVVADGDYSAVTVTATTTTYSVRALFVEEAATPPAAPGNASGTAQSPSSIVVQWDGSVDATGYYVERSSDGVTGWTNVSGNLPANPTTWANNGLPCNTTFFYRVIAFNTAGDSAPSSVVSATTDQCPPSGGNRMGGTGAIRRRGGHPR